MGSVNMLNTRLLTPKPMSVSRLINAPARPKASNERPKARRPSVAHIQAGTAIAIGAAGCFDQTARAIRRPTTNSRVVLVGFR